MPHPLQAKVAAVRRQAERLLFGFGLGRLIACGLSAAVLAAVCDYVIRFQDRGVRTIFSLLVAAAWVWAWRRYLPGRQPDATRADTAVALKLERHFPALHDRLASAIDFLAQEEADPTAGSPALRQAMIAHTTADAESLPLAAALDRRPTRRALLLAGLVVAAIVTVACWRPETVSVAAVRLAAPWGDAPWPRENYLAFRDEVRRIAAGQTFQVEVIDAEGRSLPEEVRIHYQYRRDDDSTYEEAERLNVVGGVMLAVKDRVARPFAYRVEGGDDDTMGWIPVQVIEPPLIERLTVRLTPPDYTGWPEKESDRQIQALKGTRVQLAGQATRPLAAAHVAIKNGPTIPAAIAADGHGFSIPAPGGPEFVVAESGSYAIVLQDAADPEVIGGQQQQFEIQALADDAPVVTLERPDGALFVTPAAAIDLRVLVRDALAIRRVELRYLRSDASPQGETILPLYAGPERPAPREAADGPEEGEKRTVESSWDLAPLKLKPNDQLTFYASASDYQPREGKSQPRKLTIISREEFDSRIAERQGVVLGELARLLKLQRDARSQVGAIALQIGKVGEVRPQDAAQLQLADMTQRQVEHGLTSPVDGAPGQIGGLLEELRRNKVDSPDVTRRMEQILTELRRLGDAPLPAVARDLTTAVKIVRNSLGPAASGRVDPQAEPALTAAGKNQDEVIATVERILGDLSQWDSYRRFHHDVAQIRGEQDKLRDELAATGRDTLGKDVKDLTPQQLADLERLAQRQAELARRLQRTEQGMAKMAGDLQDRDPLAAGALTDALHESRRRDVGGQMQEAAGNAARNQLGQAAERQGRVGQDLQELLDILANRRERELSRLVAKLRETEQELAALRQRQEGLRKKLQAAAQNPNPEERRQELQRLEKEQRELHEEAERLNRKLQRLEADRAAQAAGNAAARMAQAGKKSAAGDAAGASEQAERAEQDLAEAERQASRQRKQAEMDLAIEQLVKIQDQLQGLRDRQQGVVVETQRLEKLRQENDRFTRAQAASVRNLAANQAALAAETDDLTKKLAAAEVFEMTLADARGEMNRAGEALGRLETGADTLRAEQTAVRRIEQLLAAVKNDAAGGNAGGDSGTGGQNNAAGDGVRLIAELKLIKILQEEINERTKTLDAARVADGKLTPEREREYAELGDRQRKLAALALEFMKSAAADESPVEEAP